MLLLCDHEDLAGTLLAALTTTAFAPPIHGDVEVDPTAYALSGNSIHVGIGYQHLRLDLGNYAMALPQFVHGDDGFDVGFSCFGAKLQYFLRANQSGLFYGVDAGVVQVHVHLQATNLRGDDVQVDTGVHAGYRFELPAGFYVTPWLGVGYVWSADDVMLDGKIFKTSPITVFPAIHVGYRFQ